MNIVTTEWLNQNSTRSYPLASRGQSSRGFMLPDDLIVDVLIGSTSTLEIVLHSICFSRAITSFVFATIDGQAIGTVSIPAQSASVYQVFDVVAAGLGTGGTITVGPGIQNIGPAGTHVFNLPLEARCMLTTGQSSIHSMFVGSGKKTSGDIVFTEG